MSDQGMIEVNEPMALMVQVDALRRHVRCQQEPEWRGLVAEGLDDVLLVPVREAAVQEGDLIWPEPEVFGEAVFAAI